MTQVPNTTSFTDLRRNLRSHLDRVRGSNAPLFVTNNGETDAVLLSRDAFAELSALAHQADITRKIRQSKADFAAGRSVAHPEGLNALADELGVTPQR